MLGDLNIVPLRYLSRRSQDLYILASPQSPMRDLLAVGRPPAHPVAPAAGARRRARAGRHGKKPPRLRRQRKAAASDGRGCRPLLAAQSAAPPPEPPGKAIDDRYRALRDFVGKRARRADRSDAEADGRAAAAARQARRCAGSGAAAAAPTGDDAILAACAPRRPARPQPVARWLEAMVGSGNAGAHRRHGRAGRRKRSTPAAARPPCAARRSPAAIRSLPAPPTTSRSTILPGCSRRADMLDGFFNTQLRPYVDVSGAAWKGQPVEGVAAPVSPADLAQFQRAAVIRDLFFGTGGNTPELALRSDAGFSRWRREAGHPRIGRDHDQLCARPGRAQRRSPGRGPRA